MNLINFRSFMIVLFIALQAVSLRAQEGILSKQPTFEKLVLDSLELRAQLSAGEFAYKLTRKKTGDDLVQSVQSGIYSYDDRVAKSLHVFTKSVRGSDETEDVRTSIEGAVYAAEPEPSLIISDGLKMSHVMVPSTDRFRAFKPFEYRSFGFALFGDFLKISEFETVLLNHLALPNDKIGLINKAPSEELQRRGDELVTYNYGGSTMTFDKPKDLWIIRQRLEQNEYTKGANGTWKEGPARLVSGTDVDLFQYQGRWVPKKVKIMSAAETCTIDFDWIKLNLTIEEMEITFERAEELARKLDEKKSLSLPFKS